MYVIGGAVLVNFSKEVKTSQVVVDYRIPERAAK
jgi:hypothetical protein